MVGTQSLPQCAVPTLGWRRRPRMHASRARARLASRAMFTVSASSDGARAGVLATPGGPLATPALLVYTHRGGVLNLTPDLLEKLKPELQGVQIDVLQFLTQPKPEVLHGYEGSGRRFLALDAPGTVIAATARDPAVYEYTGALRQATNEWASVSVHSGAATVTPEQYMEAVAALGPDLWVALSDEVPSDSRSDRVPKAVDRTLAWLKACLAAAEGTPGLAGPGGALAFAAVQGGQYVGERVRCAEAVAAQPGVGGFVVAGLGTGESPEVRHTIVEEVVRRLPPGAARMASSLGTPEEVLEAVSQGIDMFDTAHLRALVAGGYALSFPLSPEAESAQQQQQQQQQAGTAAAAGGLTAAGGSGCSSGGGGGAAAAAAAVAAAGLPDGVAAAEARAYPPAAAEAAAADSGEDDSKLNLWALAHRTDRRPLLPGCACFTCANHTRAYVHHLLQTHEMTAQVLLELHNTHHYLQFFKAIRTSIEAGRFGAYRAWFLQRRQRWLVEGR